METINKVSETEFEKIIPQVDLVIVKTLDQLFAEKESLMVGIQNNKDRIVEQTAKLSEVDAEIEQVKGLGLKTQAEIQVAEEVKLQDAKVVEETLSTPVGKVI